MSNSYKKPILVTGSHRSGSSWVGKMISLASSAAYINEPFNIQHTPRICKAEFENWFTYICEKNESMYLNDIEDCIRFKYPLSDALKHIESPKYLAKLTKDYMQSSMYRALNKRPLLKDPIALFSAEWLAKTFNMDVIVLIRHPAAFAGSLKAAQWTHPFSHFLQQPQLMEDHLYKYRHEIEEYSKNEKDSIDQAILLWNLIHHMILGYRKNQPKWTFVKHEDLSENPLNEFRKIYNKLDLDFSSDVEKKIKDFSFAGNSAGIKRDSKSNIWSWKKRLTVDEIEKIKDRTHEIANKFYTEEDWD